MLAWLCANGALWDAMQMAAWGKMFAGYSGTMSLTQALRETFDPAKPCEMCLGIAKAKTDTAKQLPSSEQAAAAKFVLILHKADALVFTSVTNEWNATAVAAMTERTDPVPLPPPRV